MISIPVRYLYEHLYEDLGLEILAGEKGMDRAIRIPRIQKPGLALAGYIGQLHPERVQILGSTELSCLDEILAPETSIHGCLVDVYGVGILLIGGSGIGKSECALGLVERGHRLAGDDVVVIRRKAQDAVFGSAADLIKYHVEIRGSGILNIKDLFGVSSIRKNKKIELVVELVEWLDDIEVERLGPGEHTYPILDLKISFLKVPVRPGRDLTMIIEVAARNHLLQRMGYNAARDFDDTLNQRLQSRDREISKPDLEPME